MAKKARQRLSAAKGADGRVEEVPNDTIPTTTRRERSQYPSTVYEYIKNTNAQRGLQLIIVVAILSTVSQATLAPVYGSIPAGLFHRYACIGCIFFTFAIRHRLPAFATRVVPFWCFWMPTVQFIVTKYTELLGPTYGPLITESITYYPLLVLSFYVALELFHEIQHPDQRSPLSEATPACILFAMFSLIQRTSRDWLARWIGSSVVFTRIGLQMSAGMLYCMILPRSLFLPAFPSVLFTFLGNSQTPLQRTTEVLNNTLALHDYTLIDRRESVSGYISVLDSNKDGFRVMRCDHSLLGGEWLHPPAPKPGDPPRLVAEPIYAVFTMLEAIRLVDPPPATPVSERRALNIGLGIGTAPAAMIQHGIKTTILELDPVVHEFSVRYFNLPHNHSYSIGDAVAWVGRRKEQRAGQFDYIIHDVFTGGAEPIALFTEDFLSGLHMLLKPDGVIAINYAGDLNTPGTSMVYRTITSVFGQCRAFREDPAQNKENEGDFTNMVFFCRKPAGQPIKLRNPIEADFLGSGLRKAYMFPKHEITADEFQTEGDILTYKTAKQLEKYQTTSALGHWHVMRTVLPPAIWENW